MILVDFREMKMLLWINIYPHRITPKGNFKNGFDMNYERIRNGSVFLCVWIFLYTQDNKKITIKAYSKKLSKITFNDFFKNKQF